MTRAAGSSGRTLIIPGEPVPKYRPRFVKASGRAYPVRKCREAEQAIAWAARAFRAILHTGPVGLTIRFYCSKHRRGRKPDLDNLIKLVKDGLNQVVYEDDSQVVSLYATVDRQARTPRTEIEWEAL